MADGFEGFLTVPPVTRTLRDHGNPATGLLSACGRRHAPGWRRPQDEDPPPLVATLVHLARCRLMPDTAQPGDPAGDRSAPRTKVPLRDSRFPHIRAAPFPLGPDY